MTNTTIPSFDQLKAEVINWGYTVQDESGGCTPDPDDTVRILNDEYKANGITLNLTAKQAKDLAKAVRAEFRR